MSQQINESDHQQVQIIWSFYTFFDAADKLRSSFLSTVTESVWQRCRSLVPPRSAMLTVAEGFSYSPNLKLVFAANGCVLEPLQLKGARSEVSLEELSSVSSVAGSLLFSVSTWF